MDDVDEDEDDMVDDTGERGETAGREGEEGLQLNAMFCRIYIKEAFLFSQGTKRATTTIIDATFLDLSPSFSLSLHPTIVIKPYL